MYILYIYILFMVYGHTFFRTTPFSIHIEFQESVYLMFDIHYILIIYMCSFEDEVLNDVFWLIWLCSLVSDSIHTLRRCHQSHKKIKLMVSLSFVYLLGKGSPFDLTSIFFKMGVWGFSLPGTGTRYLTLKVDRGCLGFQKCHWGGDDWSFMN